jgi:3-keto-5-aminohexanoate cleavage enzyme
MSAKAVAPPPAQGITFLSLESVIQALIPSGRVNSSGWIGLEDNIYHVKGVLATNLGLLRRMKQIALAIGRDLAIPSEARRMLGLAPKTIATGQ